jgi:hypothetical protein
MPTFGTSGATGRGFESRIAYLGSRWLPAYHTLFHPRREDRTAFREPLQFIVTTVTVVTLLISIGLLRDAASAPPRDSHVIVMVTVTEEPPYLSGSLAGVTVMTLVTVICGWFLCSDFPL